MYACPGRTPPSKQVLLAPSHLRSTSSNPFFACLWSLRPANACTNNVWRSTIAETAMISDVSSQIAFSESGR